MTPPLKSVHVVAGVLRDAQERILLAERPQGKHLGGLWEFPGGKREHGESSQDALKRELLEEIGVEADRLTPLIQVPWNYSDKRIVLEMFNIGTYRGEPYSREGQKLRWQVLSELDLADLPAADRSVIHALRLPPHYVITPEPDSDDDAFIEALERVLARGERLIQLRTKTLPHERLRSIALKANTLCRNAGAELLVNADIDLAKELDLGGVHLTSAQLHSLKQRPLQERKWVGASCHNLAELQLAVAINVDFAVLSPVNATPSHPNLAALGWEQFSKLCELVPIPVYALGGMTRDGFELARSHGAQGVAGVSGFW